MRISTQMLREWGVLYALFHAYDVISELGAAILPRTILFAYGLSAFIADCVISGTWVPVHVDWTSGRAKLFALIAIVTSIAGLFIPWKMLSRRRAVHITVAFIGMAAVLTFWSWMRGAPMVHEHSPTYLVAMTLAFAGSMSVLYTLFRSFDPMLQNRRPRILRR